MIKDMDAGEVAEARERLAAAVVARVRELRPMTQRAMHVRGGLSPSLFDNLLHGRGSTVPMDTTLWRLDLAMGWPAGTSWAVWEGVPLPALGALRTTDSLDVLYNSYTPEQQDAWLLRQLAIRAGLDPS